MSVDLSALTLFDYGAFVLLLISGGLATLRGMTRELLGLAGWPISVIAARFTAPYLEPVLTDLIKVEGISAALAWGVPILYVGAVVVAEGESKLPGMVTDATITPMLRDSAHLMSGMLPTEMAKRITDNLPGASETTKDIQEAGENLGKAGDSMGEASGSGLELLKDETAD